MLERRKMLIDELVSVCSQSAPAFIDEESYQSYLELTDNKLRLIMALCSALGRVDDQELSSILGRIMLAAQSQTLNLEWLVRYSWNDDVFESGSFVNAPDGVKDAAKAVREYVKQQALKPYRDGQSKGGKKRTKEEQEKYDEHLYWWLKWQKDPSLYANLTAYDDAMRDKTRAGLTTVRAHRKEFQRGIGK